MISKGERIWFLYRNNHDPKIKEKLVRQYLPLVKYTIARLPVSYSYVPSLSRDDFISSGVIGLMKAIDSFDYRRGVKFQTYAFQRIRGAVIDELRKLDWIPRSFRQEARLLEETHFSLESRLGRPPTDKELATALSIKEDKLNCLRVQLTYFFHPLSLEKELGDGLESLRELIPSNIDNPFKVIEKKEVGEILGQIIEQLLDREKKVIILYYYEELTLKEIGEIIGVSESRVCQIHSRIILRIRANPKCRVLRGMRK